MKIKIANREMHILKEDAEVMDNEKSCEWISTADCYPNTEGQYLINIKNKGVFCRYYDKKMADNYGGLKIPSIGFEDDNITHWMNMPNPPKGVVNY